jgi:hypothetical protein
LDASKSSSAVWQRQRQPQQQPYLSHFLHHQQMRHHYPPLLVANLLPDLDGLYARWLGE